MLRPNFIKPCKDNISVNILKCDYTYLNTFPVTGVDSAPCQL